MWDDNIPPGIIDFGRLFKRYAPEQSKHVSEKCSKMWCLSVRFHRDVWENVTWNDSFLVELWKGCEKCECDQLISLKLHAIVSPVVDAISVDWLLVGQMVAFEMQMVLIFNLRLVYVPK